MDANATAAPAKRTSTRRGVGYVFRDKRSGGVIWGIAYEDVDGRLRRERTNAKTKTLAERILADRQDAVERARLTGLPSVDELLTPPEAVTLRQFAKEYLEHAAAHLRGSTADRQRWALETRILPALGGLVVSRITAGDIQRHFDRRMREMVGKLRRVGDKVVREEAPIKPATVTREIMTLSALFREAKKRGLVDRNPVSDVTKPRVNNAIVRYLAPDEEQRLLDAAPEPLRSAILVSIHSGLRESELLKLTWGDVRFGEGLLVVRETKGGRDRVVPMNETLRATLEAQPRKVVTDKDGRPMASPYCFTSDTGTRYERFNNTTWRKALAAAGITSFRWHDLRHTYGSRLAQRGASPIAIKDLMGHTDLRVTMRYCHLSPRNLRDAVALLDEAKTGPITTHGTTQQPVDTRKAVV